MQPRIPTYRKGTNGQAFIEHFSIPNNSHRLYLGKYGSEESRKRYAEVVKQIISTGRITPFSPETAPDSTIDELTLAYLDFAEGYYGRKPNGKPGKALDGMIRALRPLADLFGSVAGTAFGPLALSTYQNHLVERGYARTHVNQQTLRVKRFFKWCCANERLPADLYHKLLCVSGLKRGRTKARESAPIGPVLPSVVDATLKHVSPTVAAMIQIQRLSGMRPNEVCIMRTCDIRTAGDVWLYSPSTHKNAWRGQALVKALPRTAQEILKPFLRPNPEEFLFSPIEAEEWRQSERRKNRKSPMTPSQAKRKAKKIQKRPKRNCYDPDSYRKAIGYGIKKAKLAGVVIPHWHPNQLRHLAATEISQALGHQAAQRWLGHADLESTNIYAEFDEAELISIARKLDHRKQA